MSKTATCVIVRFSVNPVHHMKSRLKNQPFMVFEKGLESRPYSKTKTKTKDSIYKTKTKTGGSWSRLSRRLETKTKTQGQQLCSQL